MAQKRENKAGNGKRILILGASGFLGHAIYKELGSYYDTYGTYHTARKTFAENGRFFHYDMASDDVYEILERIRPQIVISALRGDFATQIDVHGHLTQYVATQDCILYFLSSANVFDAYSKYPSYEYDKTLSESIYGRLKIKIENMMLRLPEDKWGILRIPMVFGNHSPRIKEMNTLVWENQPIEVFPNLIVNVTYEDRLTQQIHYLINHGKTGIYHLGSTDLVHHEEFIKEIVERVGIFNPVLKRVYTTNEERYLAVLPRDNRLPSELYPVYQEVIDVHVPR